MADRPRRPAPSAPCRRGRELPGSDRSRSVPSAPCSLGASWALLGFAERFLDNGCQIDRAAADRVHDRVVLRLEVVAFETGHDLFDVGWRMPRAAKELDQLVLIVAGRHGRAGV